MEWAMLLPFEGQCYHFIERVLARVIVAQRRHRLVTRSFASWVQALLLCGVPVEARAQTPAAPPLAAPRPRPGLFRVGPFYLTPTLHLGPVGIDTNVFHTADDPVTDFSASGGPGLELVLPLGGSGQFFAEGNLDYLYFAKTVSQRRLRGDARGGFDFKSDRTLFHLEEYYAHTFGRPNYEIDARLAQVEEGTRLDLKRRLFGRIALRAIGSRVRFETEDDPEYLGNDLAATLTRNQYLAGGGLDYAMTVKTSFVVEGNREWDRFPLDSERDADLTRVWVGFRTDETALLAGHALVGSLWFHPVATPEVELKRTIASLDATWRVSPKTRLTFLYNRGLEFSAFQTIGLTPTVLNEMYGIRIHKDLVGYLDAQIFGRITHFATDGEIVVDIPEEGTVVSVRDDRAREVGIDLGYRFRRRFRVGIVASYVDRNSNIDYFGIDGLIFGASVQYMP
jgi:hypothetical protein